MEISIQFNEFANRLYHFFTTFSLKDLITDLVIKILSKKTEVAHKDIRKEEPITVEIDPQAYDVAAISKFELIPSGELTPETCTLFYAMNLQSILRRHPEFFNNSEINLKIGQIALIQPKDHEKNIDYLKAKHYLESSADCESVQSLLMNKNDFNDFNDFIYSDKLLNIAKGQIQNIDHYIGEKTKDYTEYKTFSYYEQAIRNQTILT